MTKFFRAVNGDYLGGFDNAEPPENSIEIPENEIPIHGGMKWDGSKWINTVKSLPPTNDEIYDNVIQREKVLNAIILSLNDGTLIPGANISNAAIKAVIRNNM